MRGGGGGEFIEKEETKLGTWEGSEGEVVFY